MTQRTQIHTFRDKAVSSQWRHNGSDGVSNHRRLGCVPNHLFRRRSKKTLKFYVTGLCEGNPPVTSGFPSQMASNAENVFVWWRHHIVQYLFSSSPISPVITLPQCTPDISRSPFPWYSQRIHVPDSKDHEADMGPTWVLSAPCWPHEPCYQGLNHSSLEGQLYNLILL